MAVTYEDIAPWCEEKFIQGGGPGGQNVNKLATTVQLRFDLANCTAFAEPTRNRMWRKLESKLTNDGALIIRANEHRTQERNREAARSRLVSMLNDAARRQKFRVPTKPSRTAKKKRADAKTRRGAVKQLRGKVKPD